MRVVKRTYALRQETIADLETQVPPGKRSELVNGLIQNWLEQRRRQRLRQEVVRGCEEMAELYLEIEREYHPLEEEVHRGLDEQPAARRGRARTTRPGRRVRASR